MTNAIENLGRMVIFAGGKKYTAQELGIEIYSFARINRQKMTIERLNGNSEWETAWKLPLGMGPYLSPSLQIIQTP